MQEQKAPYFPLFINLTGKKILFVGFGHVTMRRIRTLISFSPDIWVITREIRAEYQEEARRMKEKGLIHVLLKEFEEKDLQCHPDIVIAATEDNELNVYIGKLAKQEGALVNVASDASLCDFYFPAVASKEEITVGVTGNGRNHQKVAKVTEEIRHLLGNM